MSEVAIEVMNLGKLYRVGQGLSPSGRLTEAIWRTLTKPFSREREERAEEDLWALRDVSFEIKQGQAVGIIGRNGAGKTTLLKILSRITEPTEGEAILHGRVGSLLEVGTGFHPELTGRENIFLNGAILGMRRAEIERKFDEIVAFAEVERFLNTPVKRYSSGMYVRLAFSVAAHLDPEILIVDEVLAVGDAAFQKKCLGKMEAAASAGRTVLFVSHNLHAVKAMCERAFLLDKGRVTIEGKSRDVIDAYEAGVKGEVEQGEADVDIPLDPSKTGGQITRIRVLDSAGRLSLRHSPLNPITIEMTFVLNRDFPTLTLNAHFWGSGNILALASRDSDWENFTAETMQDVFPRKPGTYVASVTVPAPLLNSGVWEVELMITPGPARLDTQRNIFIEIMDESSFATYVTKAPRGGLFSIPLRWELTEIPELNKGEANLTNFERTSGDH